MTQKEAGLIQELLTHAGLAAESSVRCVLVDGSLRHQAWNTSLLARVRREHPEVQVALLHVVAPEATVLLRAHRRAMATGRVVPPHLLQKSLLEVPLAVAALVEQVDFAVAIDTSGPEPQLLPSPYSGLNTSTAAPVLPGEIELRGGVISPSGSKSGHGDSVQTWEAFAARWCASKRSSENGLVDLER
jgi:hypothetical protein